MALLHSKGPVVAILYARVFRWVEVQSLALPFLEIGAIFMKTVRFALILLEGDRYACIG